MFRTVKQLNSVNERNCVAISSTVTLVPIVQSFVRHMFEKYAPGINEDLKKKLKSRLR